LKDFQSLEKCRRILCYDAGCSEESALKAGLTAASALLLSNSIRHDACAVVCFGTYRGGRCLRYRLTFLGSYVKGLRVDENTVLGVINSIMKYGRWPGVILERIDTNLLCCQGCVNALEALASGKCNCIDVSKSLPGFNLKAWWLAAVTMVVCDGRGEEDK
jgi:hypothetical protein